MHTVFFGIKRAHLSVVYGITRPLIAESGLTPARFDMMRIVRLRTIGVEQGTLRWLLGVSSATVSRMLISLEELGFVRRAKDPSDKRRLMVFITDDGTKAVDKALALTVDKRLDEWHVARCATEDASRKTPRPDEDVDKTIREAKDMVRPMAAAIRRMRRALFDYAPYLHPWHESNWPPSPLFATGDDGIVRYVGEAGYES